MKRSEILDYISDRYKDEEVKDYQSMEMFIKAIAYDTILACELYNTCKKLDDKDDWDLMVKRS